MREAFRRSFAVVGKSSLPVLTSMTPSADDPRRSPPKKAQDWRVEAEKAAAAGDWSRAVVCYRRAMELAPFCNVARAEFEWALEQQVDSSPRRARRPQPASVVPVADEEAPAPAAAPQPRRKPVAGTRRAAAKPRVPVQSLAIAATLALVLTVGGLWAAVHVAGAIGYAGFAPRDPDLTALAEEKAPPAELTAALGEANKLLAAGQTKRSIEKLRTALKDHPDFEDRIKPGLAGALRRQAQADSKAKKYDSAVTSLREVAELMPADESAHIALGAAYRDLARTTRDSARKRTVLTDAEKAYREAIKLDPENGEALLGLAQVLASRNDRKQATQAFEQVVALAPKSPAADQAKRSLAELNKR